MKKIIHILMLFFLTALAVNALFSQEISGKLIMQKNYDQLYSKDEVVSIKMDLINNRGEKRTRIIKQSQRRDSEDNRMNLIRFESPADVAGTGFLSLEKPNQDDLQWLFLPTLRKSRRISPSDGSDNFMGSDFTYEDLDTEDIDDYNYEILEKVLVEEINCYLIEATPNNEETLKNSGYSKRKIYVSADNFMIRRIDFYNKKGQLSKKFTAEKITYIENAKKWRNSVILMNNIKTKHKTKIFFDDFKINTGLEEMVFSKQNLESYH